MYKTDSFCDKGTLKQLANQIGRSNIPKKVKSNFNGVHDFLNLVLDVHITAAALKFFGMENVSSLPSKNVFLSDISKATLAEKKTYFSKCMDSFIDQFVNSHVQGLEKSNISIMDGKFSYACSVIGLGLIGRNFCDAYHEGNGTRLITP